MEPLTIEYFRPHVGAVFVASADGEDAPLTLTEVEELPGSVRPGAAFRLTFTGPHDAPLGQGIKSFALGEEQNDIFIVPIGPAEDRLRYEAIFA